MNTKQRQAANNWQKLTATSAKILIALDRRSWTQTSRRAEWVLFFGEGREDLQLGYGPLRDWHFQKSNNILAILRQSASQTYLSLLHLGGGREEYVFPEKISPISLFKTVSWPRFLMQIVAVEISQSFFWGIMV